MVQNLGSTANNAGISNEVIPYLKGFCVSCGKDLNNSPEKMVENYMVRGNYCARCNEQAQLNAKSNGYNTKLSDVIKRIL